MPHSQSQLPPPDPMESGPFPENRQAEVLAFLASGAASPTEPPPERVETHCAQVFILRDRVWKLKKPVRLPFLDFTTLEARRSALREELRINLLLAGPLVYRRVLAVTRGPQGRLGIGGPGPPVDWMLEMRRLPAEEMLDRRLQMGPPPSTVEIGAVASRLLRFYRETLRPAGAGQGYLRRWQREGAVNARHLDQMRHLLGPAYDPGLGPTALDLIDACTDEILARARRGLIVEGHGDLRPEHVCLTDPPVIFDRLEFDPLLRLADPFDETGMLGQDCAAMGAGWIGSVLRGRLTTAGLPEPSPRLRLAYAVNRCLTRARLAIDHLREPAMRTPEKWPRQARSQIERAARLLASEP